MQTPTECFLCFSLGTGIYTVAKQVFGFEADWSEYFSSLYWFGAAMVWVSFGGVRVKGEAEVLYFGEYAPNASKVF